MIRLGTNTNDILPDTEFDDFIFGFNGVDTFLCYQGNDALFGGQGDDTFIIAPQTGATVYIDGGRGLDTLALARDPIDIEYVGHKMIIHYEYDMTIVTQRVEELSL